MENVQQNEQAQEQQETIETKIAYWLDSFEGHVNYIKDSQQLIHDSITEMNDQCFNVEQKKACATFLNNALSLSFLIKNYPDEIRKFVKYHTHFNS